MDPYNVRKQPYVFAISGYKNSGKTTMITRLLPELKRRGYRVAVVKHDGHDFESDVPGTDSWRHQKAGAYGTAVFSKNRILITKEWEDANENMLFQAFPEADIILLEGLKHSSYPKYVCNYPQEELKSEKEIADRIERGMKGEPSMGIVKAICISEKKGTQKYPIDQVKVIEDFGLEKDAHAGKWHRQVSLLSYEKIEEFRARGAEVEFGAFGENLVISGYDFKNVPVGTRFQCGDVILELTQIGKECHHGCQIFQKMGDCIMPREGVFCKVLHGGRIKTGDEFILL